MNMLQEHNNRFRAYGGSQGLYKAMNEVSDAKMILRSIIRAIRAGDGRVEVDFIL